MIGSTINDRYKIEAELGQGGMGTVYRAHDKTLKRDVAVKIMSNTNLGTEGRARLLREAQLTAKLSHPNIVTVFDAGEHDEAPYIVMGIVEGKTLYEQKPESLEEIVEIAKQVCLALDHAHQQDIVHRDLKPENIAFTSDGTIKLMDFGLARSTASRLTSEGGMVGTVYYMSPEQAIGDAVDTRSDLYSFGVLLYELVTGSLPFEADNAVAVITQHIHAPLVPPRAKREDLPQPLNQLIISLMQKEPTERPTSAKEVIKILEDPNLLEEGMDEGDISSLDRIVRGRMVGRSNDYEEARQIWVQTAGGQGQTLLISGEPGVGKTRLMREVFTQAEISGGQAYMGESYVESNIPYNAFSQIIRKTLQNYDKNGYVLPDAVLDDLLKLTPDLRHQFPDIEANPILDPEAEQNRLLEHFVSFCQIASKQNPLLIVIDDIHWSNSGTLAIFKHLARRTRKMPVMLLGTYREVELTEARAFNEMLLELNRQRIGERIKLNRLNEEQTKKMLYEIFQEEITPEFLTGIYRETDGNPFFIEEVCRALVESGKLVFKDGRWDRPSMEELEIPQGIQVAVESRLNKLDEATQDVLRMAAILGREFEFDILTAAMNLDEDNLINALETAEDAQMIYEVSERGDVTFAFVHALVPQSIRENIRTLRRRKLHKQASTAFEAQQPENYEALAFHALQGGDDENALKYYSMAGERALNTFASQDAIQYLLNALDLVEDKTQEASLLKNIGQAEDRVGHQDKALELWRKAIKLYLDLEELDQAAELYALAGRNRWFAGDPMGNLNICLEGLDILKDAPEGPGLATLLAETARAFQFNHRIEEGLPVGHRALEMAEKLNVPAAQSDVLNTLATSHLTGPKDISVDETVEMLEKAIQIAEDNHLWREAGRAHNNLAQILGPFQGKESEMLYHRSQCIELTQQAGDIANELFVSFAKLVLLYWLGQTKDTLPLLERIAQLKNELVDNSWANNLQHTVDIYTTEYQGNLENCVKIFQENPYTENNQFYAFWTGVLAPTQIILGAYSQAEQIALKGIKLDDESTAFNGIPIARSYLATTLAYQGKIEEANKELKTARERHQHHQRVIDNDVLLIASGQIHALSGRWDEAWSDFQRLSEDLKERGAIKYLANCYRTWGEMHLRRGEEEDKTHAKELLGQALDLYQQMEAGGWVERVEKLIEGI